MFNFETAVLIPDRAVAKMTLGKNISLYSQSIDPIR